MPAKVKRNGSAQAQVSIVQPCENDIRYRAYEIYVARGEQPGNELEDWLQAERELESFTTESNGLRHNEH